MVQKVHTKAFAPFDRWTSPSIIANIWQQEQSISWKPSLFSMQINYQLILVHWSCRTVGDHRQLYSKHPPPSTQELFEDTDTQEMKELSSYTDMHLSTLTSVASLRGSYVFCQYPPHSEGRFSLQVHVVHTVLSFSSFEITFGSKAINSSLNNGLNMFHLCVIADCMQCTTLKSAKHVSLVLSTQMLSSESTPSQIQLLFVSPPWRQQLFGLLMLCELWEANLSPCTAIKLPCHSSSPVHPSHHQGGALPPILSSSSVTTKLPSERNFFSPP